MALTKIDDRGLKTPIDLLDNEKIRLGAGNDLELFHDGSNSRIQESGTGQLQLESNTNIVLGTEGIGETYAKFVPNGTVELYHNNSKKFETSSTGVTITGDANWNDNGKAEFGNAADLQLYHDGTNSYIENSTGLLYIKGGGDWLALQAEDGENSIICKPNGAVELYHDNGKKLSTTSSGITAGNPNTSETAVVGTQVGFFAGAKSQYASATGLIQNQVSILDTATSAAAGTGGALTFGGYSSSSSATFYATIEGIKENSTSSNYAGSLKFLTRAHNTANMNQAMVINSSGDVGINCTDPGAQLQVNDTNPVIAEFYHSDGGTNDEARISLGAYSSNPPSQRGVNLIAKNNGAGHDFLVNCSSSHSAGPSEKIRVLSGGGLTFNGDTAAANALDDYEEGTFTPAVTSGLSGGAIAYNSRSGKYTKVGNLVSFTMHMNISSATLDSGALKFGGLPFTAANVSHTAGGMWKIFTNGNIDANATYKVEGNTTDVSVVTGAGDAQAANATSINAGNRHMAYWGFYYVS